MSDSGFVVIGDHGSVRHAGLPADFVSQFATHSGQGWKLQDAAFIAGGGWLQLYDQGWWAGGLPQDAYAQMQQYMNSGVGIRDFRLSPAGDWILLGGGGKYSYAPGLDQPIIDDLADAVENHHLNPVRIVFSPVPNSWCLITDQGQCRFHGDFVQDAAAAINQLVAGGNQIENVVFPPSGGWIVLYKASYWASGIPDEVFQLIGDVAKETGSTPRLAFSGLPMTFTFQNYVCIQTRSAPSLGLIGGDDTDTAEIDVRVGRVTYTARTPNSVNVGSNSQPQQINLAIGPILVPDPATRIAVALQIVNSGDQSTAEQLLVEAGEKILDAAEDKLLEEAISAIGAHVALGILATVTVAGLIAVTQAVYAAFSQNDDGLAAAGGIVGNALGLYGVSGAHSDDYLGEQPPSGRPPHYQLNWSIGIGSVGDDATLRVWCTPRPVPMGTQTSVTINAKDSITNELIAGQVNNGQNIGSTNQAFQHTFNWITKSIAYHIPADHSVHPPIPAKTVTKTYKDYPSVSVIADGYLPATVQLGPAQKPPPPPED